MADKPQSLRNPNESSDKYYASKDRSVISPPLGGRRTPLRPNPTPAYVDPKRSRQSDLTRSADVYYKDPEESKRERAEALPKVREAVENGIISIQTREELTTKVRSAIYNCAFGPVRVALADADWLAAARAQVELAVTRETITEDQARDIQFGLVPKTEVSVQTQPVVAQADDELFAVPADFVPPVVPEDLPSQEEAKVEDAAACFVTPAAVIEAYETDDDDEQFAVPAEAEEPVEEITEEESAEEPEPAEEADTDPVDDDKDVDEGDWDR